MEKAIVTAEVIVYKQIETKIAKLASRVFANTRRTANFGMLAIFSVSTVCLLSRCTTVAVVGGGVAAGAAIALREKPFGESLADTTLSKRISLRLYKKVGADIHARVGVSVHEGEVLLTGTLPEESQIRVVESAVWRVRHVKRVYNNIELSAIPAIDNYVKDTSITSQIKTKLLASASIRSLNYSIKTVNNVVYICGIARSQEELDLVVDVASRVKGVSRVMSYVRLVE
ncbi:MAG: BON domain-containing protein [Holosporales bacterium]|nr:BON domain-containing protein [Holosporales bacterium]